MSLTKIAILENEIEAQIIDDILMDRQIRHEIRLYGNYAFGNLFELQKGWGAVYASAEHKTEILEILSDLRAQTVNNSDYED